MLYLFILPNSVRQLCPSIEKPDVQSPVYMGKGRLSLEGQLSLPAFSSAFALLVTCLSRKRGNVVKHMCQAQARMPNLAQNVRIKFASEAREILSNVH